ncbi:MAG: hypothetical protein JWL62_1780, partial [Hyphomicrobiales bacterium]|nr:hypothetical protein [Hyphomicrobiales bacterium]
MTIAPSQTSFVLPEIASAEGAFAASLAKAAAAKPSAAGVGKSDIGNMQYDVDRFMRNYSGFYATFDKAQLYELCCYLSEVNHYSDTPLSYYDSAIYDSKTGVAGAIKSVTDMRTSRLLKKARISSAGHSSTEIS